MNYEFCFSDMRGDVCLTEYEGRARIERCVVDNDDWHIAGIELDGWTAGHGSATVTLDQGDELYKRIALYLHKAVSAEIDAVWAAHVREQRDARAPVL